MGWRTESRQTGRLARSETRVERERGTPLEVCDGGGGVHLFTLQQVGQGTVHWARGSASNWSFGRARITGE
jgi:hypothetical protein